MGANKYSETGAALSSRHIKDLRGQRFGKVLVKEYHHAEPSGMSFWVCKCDCGNTVVLSRHQLKHNHCPNCGCTPKDPNRPKRLNVQTHHMTGTRLYKVWKSMRNRCGCKNPDCRDYWDYAMRGITICDEWNDFENFYKWAMENGYDSDASKGECTLDRIDVNGIYEPSNCRWTSNTQQVRNRRKTVYLEYNGEKRPLTEWCEIFGLKVKTCYGRLHQYGWTNPSDILFGKGGTAECPRIY